MSIYVNLSVESMTNMTRKYTVEMTKGTEVYYPAAADLGGPDFTTNLKAARRMTKKDATAMTDRIALFATGVTGKVVPIA